MSEKALNPDSNFRELKEGELIILVQGGQPVIFKGIEKGKGNVDDVATLICLDPVEEIERREYPLDEDGSLKEGYSSTSIDRQSEGGREYLKSITGKQNGKNTRGTEQAF